MTQQKNRPFDGTDKRYRGHLAKTAWSLCVGAGISAGMIPTWYELTRRVVNRTFGLGLEPKDFDELLKTTRWSLDAHLQGCANQLEIADHAHSFTSVLEHALYEDLLKIADSENLKSEMIDALNNPRWLSRTAMRRLIRFFELRYCNSTLVRLTRELAHAKEKDKGPKAVLNFNADTLLFALLDMFLVEAHSLKVGMWEHPSHSFSKAFRGIDNIGASATPIFHCHGAVSPTIEGARRRGRHQDSRDNLVFAEIDYLAIAGSVATWAQSLFLFHAQSTRLLIVGHSLSDPNIRKWLAWSSAASMKEIRTVSTATAFTPRHIWIAKRPGNAEFKNVQEISLLHLGVRICWLDSWDDVGTVLRNLLAL